MFKSHSNFLVRASGSIERMNGCEYKPAAVGPITWPAPVLEDQSGKMKATKDIDRSPWCCSRGRHYLATGKAGQPTVIP